jgi:thiol-disulfide isomerase/thioredoxin
MKFVVTTAVGVLAAVAAPAFAQETRDVPAPAAQAVDAESVKKSEAALQESAKAYAAAKAISDVITFMAKTPDGDQSQTMKIELQGADQARITMEEMTFTATGGSLYAVRSGIDDRFAQFELEGTVADTLGGQVGFVPPQMIARTTTDVAKLVEAWTFGMLPMTQLGGHSSVKSDAGVEMHKLGLTSPAGEGEILINSASNLVEKVVIRMKMDGAPEMSITLGYEPKVSDALTPAIAFDAGTRKKVSSIEDLKIDLTGKPAPDFTLEALDGSKVTLSELKGNVVILDFWATWCGPCKQALPKLSEFTQWTIDNKKAVKVFGVDVWERGKPEDTRKAVTEYWTTSKFVMPTLLDLDNSVAKKFGFDAIPTTVIVGPDGTVISVHTGAGPDMVEELKKEIEAALAAAPK